jgi:hypothetical protein
VQLLAEDSSSLRRGRRGEREERGRGKRKERGSENEDDAVERRHWTGGVCDDDVWPD